jgi:hypothetical protein
LNIADAGQIVGLLFSTIKFFCINFDKKTGSGYIMGNFFTQSSGHPGRIRQFILARSQGDQIGRIFAQ